MHLNFKALLLLLSAVSARPVQLIKPAADHTHLECNAEGLNVLRSLAAPVAVVSAVGAVHSGKSFLLNRLIDEEEGGRPSGFSVGYSVTPETEGLWMWDRPINRAGTNVIFLDTEGFFSPNVSDTYDAKMFAITTLLSSELIYNTVKFIDNHHVELLELLIRRTSLFGLRAYARHNFNKPGEGPISNLAAFLRVLVPNQLSWVVQDFVQDLGNRQPEDWLRDLLERDTAVTAGGRDGSVGTFFKYVDCVPLPLPAGDSETLQKLDLVKPGDLNPAYRSAVDIFRDRLLSRAVLRPKMKGGNPFSSSTTQALTAMSGEELADLLEFLVVAANAGPVGSSDDQPFPQLPSISEQFRSLQLKLMNSDIIAILEKDLMGAIDSAADTGRPLARFPFDEEVAKAEKQARMLWTDSVKGLVSNNGLNSEVEFGEKDFLSGLTAVKERVAKRNCQLADEWCKRYSSDLLSAFEDSVNTMLQSPTLPAYLESELTNLQSKLKSKFQLLLARDLGGWTFSGLSCCSAGDEEDFEKSVKVIASRARATNDRLVEEAFDSHISALLSQWTHDLSEAKVTSNLVTSTRDRIEPVLAGLQKTILADFNSKLAKYRGLNLFHIKRSALEKSIYEHEKEFWAERSLKCQAVAEEFLRSASVKHRFNLHRLVSLPVDEVVLDRVLEEQSTELNREFQQRIFCLKETEGQVYRKRFDAALTDTAQSLKSQNMNTIKEISGQNLKDLREDLLAESATYYWPQHFENMAYARVLATLREAVAAYEKGDADSPSVALSAMSDRLLQKVTRDFLKADLAAAVLRVRVGIGLLIGGFALTALLGYNAVTYLRDGCWSDAARWGFICIMLGIVFAYEDLRSKLRSGICYVLSLNILLTVVLGVTLLALFAFLVSKRSRPQPKYEYTLEGKTPLVTHSTPYPSTAYPSTAFMCGTPPPRSSLGIPSQARHRISGAPMDTYRSYHPSRG